MSHVTDEGCAISTSFPSPIYSSADLFPHRLVSPVFTTFRTMNGDWNRPAPRQDYPRESGPSDASWAATGPFMEDMLDIEGQYPQQQQFEGPPFLSSRPTQSNGQYGYRGRSAPQPHSQSHGGNTSRAAEVLGSPFDSFRPPNTRQNGAARSWLDLNSPETRRPNLSSPLEDLREESKREIGTLSRRLLDLEAKLERKNRELEAEVVGLENQVTKLNDLKLSEVAERVAQGEEKFRNQMNENNEVVSAWLQEIKAHMERFMESGARPNGGSGGNWDGIHGDDVEEQAMLSEVQSFNYIK